MTRLVDVRAVCDGCSAAAATVFCVSHRNVLCPSCDLALHTIRSTPAHQRVNLSSAVTALPFCEHCDDAPATTYCESESLTLCDKCDTAIHQAVETPHYRKPIERTLRSRGVEFRGGSRFRQTGKPRTTEAFQTHPSREEHSSPEKRGKRKDFAKHKTQSVSPNRRPSTASATRQRATPLSSFSSPPLPANVSSATSKQSRTQHPRHAQAPSSTRTIGPVSSTTPPPLAPRRSSPQQRRRPRPSIRRRRDMRRVSQQMQSSIPSEVPPSRAQAQAPPTDHFSSSHGGARTAQQGAYNFSNSLSTHQQSHSQSLQEQLLVDSQSRYLDLDMMGYEGLDLSGEATAIEGVSGSGKSASMSGSAAESGASSSRNTPDIDMLTCEPRVARNTPTPASLREVVASAVAAAGEQFLLNSVSSGSGSSGERESPPLDMSCTLDPAGLVAAATAAAASVAAQIGATVGLGHDACRGVSSPMMVEAVAEGLTGRIRQPRLERRVSEPAIPTVRDMAEVEAAKDAISDEAMRRLEMENRRAKQEDVMRVDSDHLVSQMCEGEDVLRRGYDMGYLEIPRDEFGGVFDSIDLSQFGTGEFRATLDSDEG